MLTLYHNNRCSKSRECLNIIKKSNLEYQLVEYLKVRLEKNVIKSMVYGLKKELPILIREKEKSIKLRTNIFKIFNNWFVKER